MLRNNFSKSVLFLGPASRSKPLPGFHILNKLIGCRYQSDVSTTKLHPLLRQRAEQLASEQKSMSEEMSAGGSDTYTPEKATRFSKLTFLANEYSNYLSAEQEYSELESMLDDPLLRSEAEGELAEIESKLESLSSSLQSHILPSNPFIEKGAILELRPGVGGSEAMLFTQDLLEMYQNYSNKQRWPSQIVSLTPSPAGGITEAIITVNQPGAYAQFQYEGGVHRVQRIPATESKGRVHTSTAAVVVLPQLNTDASGASDEAERTFAPGEVRIDVMRARGAGGQHVNTTESAVRLTHIPSGIVVAMQDERSQHKNKAKAFMVLRARVAERERLQKIEEEKGKRTAQVQTTLRSDKIRTYNYVQNRITDHRCNNTSYHLMEYIAGEPDAFDDMVKAMDKYTQECLLKDMIAEEEGKK